MSKAYWLLNVLVVVARDMFIGFLLGICATVILAQMNPGTNKVVAILIPAGTVAGIMKGTVKAMVLSMFNAVPGQEAPSLYPKFGLLLFWTAILVAVLLYSYGPNPWLWLSGPAQLIRDNRFFASVNYLVWCGLGVLTTVIGLGAYFYEPSAGNKNS